MECPYCGAELIEENYYGKRKYAEHYYIYPQSWIEKEGDILKCPNSEGFSDIEEAEEYIRQEDHDCSPEDVCCYSSIFKDFFYTDSREELHEGYPC